MRYNKLGLTDLKVSALGFGASPLGDVFGVTDPAEGSRAVHFAIDQGVNFFDVSPYYGLTLAEERLGHALVGRREAVVLATKVGRYGSDEFDFSAKRVARSVDDSLRRLRTDHVDLFQVHDIEFGTVHQIITETLPEMERLKRQGKVRYVGITGYSLKMLLRVAAAASVDAMLSYCHYDLLVADIDDFLAPFAQHQGIGLINASPFHMGMLTEGGPPSWHPAPANVVAASRRAQAVCASHGVRLTDAALRFCLAHPSISSTLVGMATQQHVRENLESLSELDDVNLTAEIRAAMAPDLNVVWPSGHEENF